MSRDHEEVGRFTDQLVALKATLSGDAITKTQVTALRRTLYGLYTLVRLHFSKKEEIYLPILDETMSPAEGRSLFTSMETVAAEIKSN